jgi:hypothetical protein
MEFFLLSDTTSIEEWEAMVNCVVERAGLVDS